LSKRAGVPRLRVSRADTEKIVKDRHPGESLEFVAARAMPNEEMEFQLPGISLAAVLLAFDEIAVVTPDVGYCIRLLLFLIGVPLCLPVPTPGNPGTSFDRDEV
jgi:hypothetical protein